MDLGISGRMALITGASRGIGAETCKILANEGVRIIAVARSAEDLEILENSIPSKGHYFWTIDLEVEDGLSQLFKKIDEASLDISIIVNNLGGTLDINNPLCSASQFLRVMNFNLGIAIEINNQLIPKMRKSKWGRICHVSSISALENQGPPSYSASKAATNAYVRSVGRFLAQDNVIMTSFMPGAIFTEGGYWDSVSKNNKAHMEEYVENRMSIKRLGRVDEAAKVISVMVSELSSFMVGTSILADGGQGRVFQPF